MQHPFTDSQVYRKPGHFDNRRKRAKRQTQMRTRRDAADGFLSKSFSPVIGRNLALLGSTAEIQKEYFNSLNNLAAFYKLKIPSVFGGYPVNVKQSFQAVKDQFDSLKTGLELIIVKDEERKACISTAKRCDTGMCLFYIAVKPLAALFQNPYKKHQANLLLSVFAYLHQVAGVPDFHDGYVGSEYEYIFDSYTDGSADVDEEDCKAFLQWHKTMTFFGRKLFKSIRHPYQLQQLETRVENFIAKTEKDNELLAVSKQILALYLTYPSRRIFDIVPYEFFDPDEEQRILPDQYISFFWDAGGLMYDQLMEFINVDFQEISCTEEPVAFQYFDKPQQETKHDLSFEEAFFSCLHNLADLLDIL